jgi:hypothetical protein
MAVRTIQGLGLVLVMVPCVASLGCELVIGDENRTVVDGGDAALPDAALPEVMPPAVVPPAVVPPDDGAASSDTDSGGCVGAQTCIETATTCAAECAEKDAGCVGNGPLKGCPIDVPACKMTCLSQCAACARCPTADSICANAAR